jgi:hypothetical protein
MGVSGICAVSLCTGVSSDTDSNCIVVSLVLVVVVVVPSLVLGAAGVVKELLVKFLNI